MTTQWKWVPFDENELSLGKAIHEKFHIHPVVGNILTRRGVSSIEEAQEFLYPRMEDLHDPFLMRDMQKAVERLNKAVGTKENILIYGDYDVDGTTAVALVYRMLRLYGVSPSQLFYYIPDRNNDGYGISTQGIDYANQHQVKLIIALDCGIKANEEIQYAKDKGIDFIVCDHHTPDEELPNAVAVLDPKRKDNSYPFTELSGCGIGFKLMQAFAINNNLRQSRLNSVLELCAISIAADLVSVLGENRILAQYGLKQLNKNPSPALQGILKSSQTPLNRPIDFTDITFKIAPLLNASGRMLSGMQTVELLLSPDVDSAVELCHNIIKSNERRKKLDRLTTQEALAMIEESQLEKEDKLIALYKPTWHKGVIGIVSSRLASKYARPVLILAGEDESISGSARSDESFDIYAAIDQFKHLLVNFGGHPFAAGLTIKKENLPEFLESIRDYANEVIEKQRFVQEVTIDAEIKLPQLGWKLYNDMNRLGPFGPDNQRPVFLTKYLYDTGGSKVVGKESKHLMLDITDASNRRYPYFVTIAFGKAGENAYIKGGNPFSIAYTLQHNSTHYRSKMQLLVKDIHRLERE